MGKSVDQIIAMFAKQDPDLEVIEDAVKNMTKIPRPFVGMAVKKTVKRAHQEGVTVIDKAFAEKIKRENWG
jgi:Cft2 family RNA processing exonuclease